MPSAVRVKRNPPGPRNLSVSVVRVIMEARKIILNELDEIAALVSRETGKPSAEAISMELAPGLDLMQHFARKSAHVIATSPHQCRTVLTMGRSSYEIYKPLGVVGIISP